MARRRRQEPLKVERTRTSSTWIAVGVAVVFLVLLIIFIAQNEKKVPIHFLGAYGQVSEALALVAAAVAGAVLVLAVGAARIVQLRVVGRRYNRAVAKSEKRQDAEAKTAAATATTKGSAGAAPGEAQAVEAKD
jgi:uncharacterized integral membrane protein